VFSLVNASQYSPRLGHGRQGDCKEPSLEKGGKAVLKKVATMELQMNCINPQHGNQATKCQETGV